MVVGSRRKGEKSGTGRSKSPLIRRRPGAGDAYDSLGLDSGPSWKSSKGLESVAWRFVIVGHVLGESRVENCHQKSQRIRG
jgi:hypothetical protein